MTTTDGGMQADHLCVLVHGFYGAPDNMQNIVKSLRDNEHVAEKVHFLVAKSNSGSFTTDGIDRGAERLCTEIGRELKLVESAGGKITKFSMIGYSLGGLVARYASGLLYASGFLDTVECKNFTTFATPHLGVRNPLKGVKAFLWNVIASRSLSISGREMFAIDTFRDTGRPVLAVLADPDSVFISGLEQFQRLSLYCNITNDMNTDYYTTSIQRVDPFTDLEGVMPNYLEGYDSVMLDPAQPVKPRQATQEDPATVLGSARQSLGWLRQVPYYVALPVYAPVFVCASLVYSLVETTRSTFRISRHDSGAAGISTQQYRIPLLIRKEAERAALKTSGDSRIDHQHRGPAQSWMETISELQPLAIDSNQVAMIEGLDTLSWRRHPVWIRKKDKAHEAIIMNSNHRDFEEGRVVLGHFANEEFVV